MNNKKMLGKFTFALIQKIILLVVLILALAYVIQVVRIRIMASADICESEKRIAERFYLNNSVHYISPSTLLIDKDDLPSRLSFVSDADIFKLDTGTDISSLDNSKARYVLPVAGENSVIEQDVYWFGLDTYSYCRYKELVHWEIRYKPSNLKWNSNRPIGLDIIDSVNCFGKSVDQEVSSCVWVGKYGNYVVSFFAPIGQGALSFEEFNAIIVKIDQKMREGIQGY
jgi:hypothetical protein